MPQMQKSGTSPNPTERELTTDPMGPHTGRDNVAVTTTAENSSPPHPANSQPTTPPVSDNFVVPKLPSLENRASTKEAIEQWIKANYSNSGDVPKNREDFCTQVLGHLKKTGETSALERYVSALDQQFRIQVEKSKIKFTLKEEPSVELSLASVNHDESVPVLHLPNNPRQQYIGQNDSAKSYLIGKRDSPDRYEWGPAMPRSLVGLHELEHVQQARPTKEQFDEAGMRIAGPDDPWEPHPRMYFMEPAAVLGEYVCAANAAREATGWPVEGHVPLAPGYEPTIDWLRQQAEQHGYKPLGGDKNMTELLNTPAGQAWLRMQLQGFADEQVKKEDSKRRIR